jgi:hypothetical protein
MYADIDTLGGENPGIFRMQEISKYVTRFKFSEYFETSKFSKFV